MSAQTSSNTRKALACQRVQRLVAGRVLRFEHDARSCRSALLARVLAIEPSSFPARVQERGDTDSGRYKRGPQGQGIHVQSSRRSALNVATAAKCSPIPTTIQTQVVNSKSAPGFWSRIMGKIKAEPTSAIPNAFRAFARSFSFSLKRFASCLSYPRSLPGGDETEKSFMLPTLTIRVQPSSCSDGEFPSHTSTRRVRDLA